MNNVDIEIYISNLIRFFETNPNDLITLIGDIQKDEFYTKLREKSEDNYSKGLDIVLSKDQIINIVLDMKIPQINDHSEVSKLVMKTKFGDIIMN
jgi:hypothetical protein